MCKFEIATAKIGALLSYVTCLIVKSFIPIIFAIAIVAFVWGVLQFFIFGADEEAKREKGKQFIVWGLVALAVMLSVLGLVRILGNTFGILPGGSPTSPGGGGKGSDGEGGDDDPCGASYTGTPYNPQCEH